MSVRPGTTRRVRSLGAALAALLILAGCGGDTSSTTRTVTAGSAEVERFGQAPVGVQIPTAVASASVTLAPTPEPTPEAAEPAETSTSGQGQAAPRPGGMALRIPALGVTAPIISITMGADRVLWPPADPAVLGWWSEGAAPGASRGSAVLVGHSTRSGSAPLNQLGSLSIGETVEVDTSSGSLRYSVDSVEVLTKDQLPGQAQRVFDQGGPGRLVIVTCTDFDGQVWQSNIITIASPA